jgi:putative ABC transport system permease protein
VVGVADDTKYVDLREDERCTLYRPLFGASSQFVIATDVDPDLLDTALANTVTDFDPTFEAREIRTVGEIIDATLVRESFVSKLIGGFAMLALVVAAIGVYGTLSYAVASRTREIGIRMALGARLPNVIGLFIRETGWTVGIGILTGCIVAAQTSRLLTSLLFGLEPTDFGTFFWAAFVISATSVLAAWLPVRRAGRVAPAVALGSE